VLWGPMPAYFGVADLHYESPGATYSGCDVWISDLAIDGGPDWVLDTLAHEIFHCFQGAAYGTDYGWRHAPGWAVEGGAEWVGNDYLGEAAPTDTSWDWYLLMPSLSLQARSYSAVGFWAHLEETTGSPWKVFPAVFKTGPDGEAAFVATGASA